ncbi:MAG: hypothetical protein ABSB35_12240 [Bryobacteraceae bacterium]|jgi:hypothetical protein
MTASDTVDVRIAGWQRNALLLGVAGTLLALAGLLLDRQQFLRSYLYAYFFWTGMALGCLGILLLHNVVGGKWGLVIRRLCEAGARTLPYMAVLLIPVLLSLTTLYPWAQPEAAQDANIQSKAGYLNVPGVIGRAVFYFAIWILYTYLLTKWSADQDRTGDERLIEKMRVLSTTGLIVFTLTGTFAFVDWIMSLEPHWFSTIYGAMVLIGHILEAFALVIAVVVVLARQAPLINYVTPQHLHDLGNMMFAFMVLWAYLSFSQFIIIWSGNLPDEIPWYLRRLNGGWGWVAIVLVLFHFAVPFVVLLMRGVKRQHDRLFKVCLLLIVMRLINVYWTVEPSFYQNQLKMHWLDFVMPVAVGGLWLAAFFWQLRSRPLVPIRDPRLAEAPRETVAF